jgi:hypothetical protein
MSKFEPEFDEKMRKQIHALNGPALKLIGDILDKHAKGMLTGFLEEVDERNTRANAGDWNKVREIAKDIRRCAGNNNADFHRSWADKLTASLPENQQ